MANATAKVNTLTSNADDLKVRRPLPTPSSKTTYYPGAFVCIDTATGLTVKGASGAGLKFDGVISNGFHIDAVPGDANSYTYPAAYLEVFRTPRFRAATATAVAATDLLAPVYLVDDQTVTKTAPTNAVQCGTILLIHGPNDITVQALYPS